MKPIERVLLTNDDGIDAPGLAVLRNIASKLAREVWTVAPEHDQSGTSHSISLHSPLRVSRRDDRTFAVSGTPGDCAAMALRHLMPQAPDLVLSGVNRGANLGVETVFSGTVGAAMTAMLLGCKAIALSQAFTDRANVRWETAEALGPAVVEKLFASRAWAQRGFCLNVNFPDVPARDAHPLRIARQGLGNLEAMEVTRGQDPRGVDYHWLALKRRPQAEPEDAEAAILRQGGIAVTPLQFERTHEAARAFLVDDLRS